MKTLLTSLILLSLYGCSIQRIPADHYELYRDTDGTYHYYLERK